MAKDPIASPSFFPGSFTRTRGMGVVRENGLQKRHATFGQVVGFGPRATSGCLMKYAMVI
jgi:hypothetical protein